MSLLAAVGAFLLGGCIGAEIHAIAASRGVARTSLPNPLTRARRGLKTITSRTSRNTIKVRTDQDERRFPPRPRHRVPWPEALAKSAEPDNRPRLTPPTSRQAMLLTKANQSDLLAESTARLEEITETVRAQLGHVADDGTWIGEAFNRPKRPPKRPPKSPA